MELNQPKALQSLYKSKCLKKTEYLCKNSAASLVQCSPSFLLDPQVYCQKSSEKRAADKSRCRKANSALTLFFWLLWDFLVFLEVATKIRVSVLLNVSTLASCGTYGAADTVGLCAAGVSTMADHLPLSEPCFFHKVTSALALTALLPAHLHPSELLVG